MSIELCKDLTANHYPEIGRRLQQLIESRCGIESHSIALRRRIKNLFIEYLDVNKIKHRDGDRDGTYLMIDSIPVKQFIERLWPLVENGSYNDGKFYLDEGYHDMIRIGFSDLGQGVYAGRKWAGNYE
jgi:hypothetical protein